MAWGPPSRTPLAAQPVVGAVTAIADEEGGFLAFLE